MKKRFLQIALYSGLILMSWIIVGLGSARMDRSMAKGLKPVILNEENNHFINMEDVERLVRDIQGRPIEECARGEVQIARIEDSLMHNPFVKTAEAYKRLNGEVVVEMELRKPLARVMYGDGSGFYLDKEFTKVDLSARYTANIVLVRGLKYEPLEPRDSIMNPDLAALQEFLEYVDRSQFLRSLISEVVVDPRGELTIYPEIGDLVIEFGPPVRIQEKFNNLLLFYRRVLNKVGWKKYRGISLKYRDQIVARK
jgi:cell division protein FtsQ